MRPREEGSGTGDPRIEFRSHFAAIGAGERISNILLSQRECNSGMDVSYVSYLVYEAKRASEKEGSVGRFTSMCVQGEHNSLDDSARLGIFNGEGLANLESMYSGLWKLPLFDPFEIPSSFFYHPKRDTTSSIPHSRSATPAAIAGVTRSVW
jgi:hypothetical protein